MKQSDYQEESDVMEEVEMNRGFIQLDKAITNGSVWYPNASIGRDVGTGEIKSSLWNGLPNY